MGNGLFGALPFEHSEGELALLGRLRVIRVGQVGGAGDKLLQLLFRGRSTLREARGKQLLRQQNLAHPPLGKDKLGRPVEPACSGSANEQLALDQVGERRVALGPVGADRQIARTCLGVEFGKRNLHPVHDGNDLAARLSGVTGGQQQKGRTDQCSPGYSVPRATAGRAKDTGAMETVYDWITVMIFAGLVTLFLSHSIDPRGDDDSLWHYALPAVACGLANWLGNQGYGWAAVILIAAALGYMLRFLRAPSPPRH